MVEVKTIEVLYIINLLLIMYSACYKAKIKHGFLLWQATMAI